MKKLFALVLSLTMVLALAACGSESAATNPPATDPPAETQPATDPATPADDGPATGGEAIDTTAEIDVAENGMSNLKITGVPGESLLLQAVTKSGDLSDNQFLYTPDGIMTKTFFQAFTSVTYNYTYTIADKTVTDIVDTGSGESTIETLKGIGMFDDVQNTVIADDEAIQAWFSDTYGMSIADYLAG